SRSIWAAAGVAAARAAATSATVRTCGGTRITDLVRVGRETGSNDCTGFPRADPPVRGWAGAAPATAGGGASVRPDGTGIGFEGWRARGRRWSGGRGPGMVTGLRGAVLPERDGKIVAICRLRNCYATPSQHRYCHHTGDKGTLRSEGVESTD